VPSEGLDNRNEDFVASSKRIGTSTILQVLRLSCRLSDVLHSFDVFPTIEGGVLKKSDGKVKRSAPSVNGVAPRVKENERGFFFRCDASRSRDRYRTLMVPAATAGS
jgi:hypothetical protein